MEKKDRIFLGVLSLILLISFFLDQQAIDAVKNINLGFGFIFSKEILVLLFVIISIYFYKRKKKLIFPLWMSVVASAVCSIILKTYHSTAEIVCGEVLSVWYS